jgi:hypothetical protein
MLYLELISWSMYFLLLLFLILNSSRQASDLEPLIGLEPTTFPHCVRDALPGVDQLEYVFFAFTFFDS